MSDYASLVRPVFPKENLQHLCSKATRQNDLLLLLALVGLLGWNAGSSLFVLASLGHPFDENLCRSRYQSVIDLLEAAKACAPGDTPWKALFDDMGIEVAQRATHGSGGSTRQYTTTIIGRTVGQGREFQGWSNFHREFIRNSSSTFLPRLKVFILFASRFLQL